MKFDERNLLRKKAHINRVSHYYNTEFKMKILTEIWMFFYVHKTASKTIEIVFFLLNGYKVLILLNYVRLKCLIK